MPRKRSGSLTFRRGRYWALVTVGKKGEAQRRWIDLRTADESEATRKKDRFVADILAGRLVPKARTQGEALVTVRTFAKDWLEARETEGVVMGEGRAVLPPPRLSAHWRSPHLRD